MTCLVNLQTWLGLVLWEGYIHAAAAAAAAEVVGEDEDDGDDDGGDVRMGGKRRLVVGEVAWQSSKDLEWQHV
jgi:hypothetical protein